MSPMDPAQMASGSQPSLSPQTQIAPGANQTANPQKLMQALKACIQQSVNQQGYVDMNKLVLAWPQISQQMGINIPFQTVLQLIQQNPDMLDQIIVEMGLAGIIVNGRTISSQELMGQATGASGTVPGQGVPPPGMGG